MKISGFSLVKNADKFYIPVKESILSVLPIVDEFIIVVGDNDKDDKTLEIVKSIKDDKLKIYHSVWDAKSYTKDTMLAKQTDLAKSYCKGDWLMYVQADEVLHQEDYETINRACSEYLDCNIVDGFTFEYLHFWGDYWHYNKNHVWYPREIRMIRNDKSIHSWRDAQSFRKYLSPPKTYKDYQGKKGTQKLNIIELPAKIYHYGHVKPPKVICQKFISCGLSYHGQEKKYQIEKRFKTHENYYGNMSCTKEFKGTSPECMQQWIAKFDWKEELVYHNCLHKDRVRHKHHRLRYRIISWIENYILGRQIFGFNNYKSLGKYKC